MTDEEKKAIVVLKQFDVSSGYCHDCPMPAESTCIGCIDDAETIVLNLIEKQQNTIEKYYILKQKIKDKIEELEDVLDMLKTEKVAKYKIRLIEEEIIDFEELLEEE